MKKIAILGATGTIGANTLDVVRFSEGQLGVCALAGGRNIALLAQQMEEFCPKLVAVLDTAQADALKKVVGRRFGGEILHGDAGYAEVAGFHEADLVVSAMVGAAGLKPTIAAINAGKDIAIANKETLVMAGRIVMTLAEKQGTRVLPIDSEHSAIFQCLNGEDIRNVSRIIITASGGPFFRQEITKEITPASAMQHPRWRMGKKISIDSATMMNKGLELIEARWLFGVSPDRLVAIIHPQSIVHSLVEFNDGSLLAQLAAPDMRLAIAYALHFPERKPLNFSRLDLVSVGALEFFPPDEEKFPCLAIARSVLHTDGILPAVMNAANEIAVEAFLAERIDFLQISSLIAATLSSFKDKENPSLEEIIQADALARAEAERILTERVLVASYPRVT
ncbi:MAG: 1-deoxy-D-xylulose-5-phosphate reductoisomerase [Deltaproteobacteria bacterium]|nr:1-deoxy-D-xylulose-5-phosphate reductoisomerase [Deltaproteobacteria bacterium]